MAKQTVEIEFIETEAAYRRALKRLAMFFLPESRCAHDTEFRLLMLMVENTKPKSIHFPGS